MRSAEIYSLNDPETGEVRYVGKTSCGVDRRLYEHIYNARHHRSHNYNWIRALDKRGLRPTISILERIEAGGDWQAAERKWIAYFRSLGVSLLNGTDGGEGVSGPACKPSAETRARMSAAHLGVRPTEAARKKRSDSLRRFYSDPAQMARRRALGAQAGKSHGSRRAASNRMKAIWSDPVRAEEMRMRMRGAKRRKREAGGYVLSTARETESN